jgi:hypothetical protein
MDDCLVPFESISLKRPGEIHAARAAAKASSAPELFCRNSAAVPATNGTAWEVPERYSVALSEVCEADRMSEPGAQMSTHLP